MILSNDGIPAAIDAGDLVITLAFPETTGSGYLNI
jgi:hypothetical protein